MAVLLILTCSKSTTHCTLFYTCLPISYRFISTCSQPLRLVEQPEFREFLEYLNPDTLCWLPRAHSTIGIWVQRQYESYKQRVKQNLKNALSKIHVSCDLWTSPNGLPILALIFHYLGANKKVRRTVAALRELSGSHTGENLASVVMEVVKDWDIQHKLGYFMMDNASDNDVMIRHVAIGKFIPLYMGFTNKLGEICVNLRYSI